MRKRHRVRIQGNISCPNLVGLSLSLSDLGIHNRTYIIRALLWPMLLRIFQSRSTTHTPTPYSFIHSFIHPSIHPFSLSLSLSLVHLSSLPALFTPVPRSRCRNCLTPDCTRCAIPPTSCPALQCTATTARLSHQRCPTADARRGDRGVIGRYYIQRLYASLNAHRSVSMVVPRLHMRTAVSDSSCAYSPLSPDLGVSENPHAQAVDAFAEAPGGDDVRGRLLDGRTHRIQLQRHVYIGGHTFNFYIHISFRKKKQEEANYSFIPGRNRWNRKLQKQSICPSPRSPPRPV